MSSVFLSVSPFFCPSAKANCLTTSTVKLFAILFETLLFFILGSQFDPSSLPDVWDFALAVLLLITVARFNL